MHVIKIGGNELSDSGFIALLARTLAGMKDETTEPVIIVHGGGRAIAGLQKKLGLKTVKVDGLRVTNLESLTAAEMVLSAHSNKIVVKALLAAGVDALGISGVDGALLRCRKKQHQTVDLGYVGEIVQVRAKLLLKFAAMNITTVLSPISLGLDGLTYNVNADEAAAAVASSIGARQLDFVSNVPGVLKDGIAIPHLSSTETDQLIAAGTISDGMIPKVLAAVDAIQSGVAQARIVDLAGLAVGGGTRFFEHTPIRDRAK